ncbi:hypothetical protein KFZ58_16030 [Virgibacillus sp. NKC19-16]|uniref:hypothetical protein n=1 Tax=Virgibacillus salidurans TaxID=2831673 RepID=UPI001F327F6E|nr:hypothetical protein [Virgibacillus sp. NKC19-16]UJL45868.1 hypothetical protein KFZ58_16030 [Virgibacillus sp. NKC19-16]
MEENIVLMFVPVGGRYARQIGRDARQTGREPVRTGPTGRDARQTGREPIRTGRDALQTGRGARQTGRQPAPRNQERTLKHCTIEKMHIKSGDYTQKKSILITIILAFRV